MAANLFSDVFKFAGATINQALTPDNLRDYRHASKLFVDDQYRLVPKTGFLFHVFFDINPDIGAGDIKNPNRDRELGMLVKSVDLPKFNIDTKKFNAYNRVNYIQTKINYESINITFHDDSADVVRNFWYDYYSHYYRDSDYTPEMYGTEHKYRPTRPTDKWGYTQRFNMDKPYLTAIRIYSLSRKSFSEYRLVNPIIKSFRHGNHQQGSNDTVQHDMTIEYESVLYFYGTTSANTVKGFADLHYDKTPSPLTPAGGGTKSILGPGGLFETGSEAVQDLADGNYASAIFKGAKAIKTARSMDLKRAAIGEVIEVGKGIVRGNNPENRIFVPSLPDLSTNLGKITSGLGGGSTWLAGAAGLSLASKSTKTSDPVGRQEVTDASNFRSRQTVETPKTSLPSDSGISPLRVARLETMNAVSTVPAPITQTDINYRGEKFDLQYQLNRQKQSLSELMKNQQQTKKQQQLVTASLQTLTLKRDSLLDEGYSEDSLIIKDLNLQIANQIEQQNNLDQLLDSINHDMNILKEDIITTEMRIQSLR